MDLLTFHTSSFVKCLFKSFDPFLLVTCHFIIQSYIIYAGYQSFDILIANMFPELIDFYILSVFQSTVVIILFNVQMVRFLTKFFFKKRTRI